MSAKIDGVMVGITRLFLDTAPVIYYIEKEPQRFIIAKAIFNRVDTGQLMAVTSPITLAECLVLPYRLGRKDWQQDFAELIINGSNTLFVSTTDTIAQQAAELRAKYNLTLTDAIQIATGIDARCEAFLTNDMQLKRVAEIRVLVLDELSI
jgi:predicted nucleic acid-binding protein